MSHTNSTTNYSLPQFITTDKPAWLTDINNAFLAIDTGMNNAQNKADSAQNDATQALSDASSAATAAATADAKGAGAVSSIETAFDPAAVYSVGDKVMYNSLLYRCIVDVVTPGPWTGSTNWQRITVDSMINTIAADVATNTTDIANNTTAINGKAPKPVNYICSGETVTVVFNSIGDCALLVINRGYNAYDGVYLLVTGVNNNNAIIVELYNGASIAQLYKNPDGLGFTIRSSAMMDSSVTVVPIRGTFTITG